MGCQQSVEINLMSHFNIEVLKTDLRDNVYGLHNRVRNLQNEKIEVLSLSIFKNQHDKQRFYKQCQIRHHIDHAHLSQLRFIKSFNSRELLVPQWRVYQLNEYFENSLLQEVLARRKDQKAVKLEECLFLLQKSLQTLCYLRDRAGFYHGTINLETLALDEKGNLQLILGPLFGQEQDIQHNSLVSQSLSVNVPYGVYKDLYCLGLVIIECFTLVEIDPRYYEVNLNMWNVGIKGQLQAFLQEIKEQSLVMYYVLIQLLFNQKFDYLTNLNFLNSMLQLTHTDVKSYTLYENQIQMEKLTNIEEQEREDMQLVARELIPYVLGSGGLTQYLKQKNTDIDLSQIDFNVLKQDYQFIDQPNPDDSNMYYSSSSKQSIISSSSMMMMMNPEIAQSIIVNHQQEYQPNDPQQQIRRKRLEIQLKIQNSMQNTRKADELLQSIRDYK